MNLRHLTARTAVAGVTVALAAGALVGLGSSAANAETGTALYNCSAGSTTLPLSVSAAGDLSGYPSLASGTPVSAGLVAIGLTLTVPAEVVDALMAPPYNQTQIGGGSSDLAFPIGNGSVPIADFTIDPVTLVAHQPAVLTKSVSNEAFKLPDAGAAAVKMPKTFGLSSILPLTCTTDSQPTITTYTIAKQTAGVTVKAPKSVKKGKAFALAVKVAGQNKPATGKVVAKVGKKVVGAGALKNGKAAIKVKKGLKKTSKITVVYAGDKSTSGAKSFPVTVKVKK